MRPLAIVVLLAGAACVAYAAARASARPQAAPDGDTQSQIRALIGTAACSDNSQCHTLALGARPCGGPQAYLAWSSAHTDGAALAALGERFKKEREAAIEASGELSTCQFLPDPGATCRGGICQLNPVSANGQWAI